MAQRIRIVATAQPGGARVELEDGTLVPGVRNVTIKIDRNGARAIVEFIQPIVEVVAEREAA